MANKTFQAAFGYKVIYMFTLADRAHEGLIKIGDATLRTDTPIDKLAPNSHELNQAALQRIKSYTNTAGITPNLLWTELAVRTVPGKQGDPPQLKAFRDHDVHAVLKNSGISNESLGQATGKEWYKLDLGTAKKAVEAVKQCRSNLSGFNVGEATPIVFRPEQELAINSTIKRFKKADRMLWNAKMRFGKTICALQVVKECGFKKTIIITHRPVVDAGWYEDFNKVFIEGDFVYGSKASGYTAKQLLKQKKGFVYFASIQDLRSSELVGGKFSKNEEIFDTTWECVIVDEAHEGTTTALGEDVIKGVVKEAQGKTKFLALSGTPFNIVTDFEQESIYTWDYIMEQECKSEWDKQHFGDSNPYEELPELKIYTYDLGDVLTNSNYIAVDDKAFNFREFFRTWTGDAGKDYDAMPVTAQVGDFVHEADVRSFLNLLTKEDAGSQYPFSNAAYRDLFHHTLWMVPGVKEARALSKLLQTHPVFGNFNIVNVAGDGDEEDQSEEALSKVRNAIEEAGEDDYTITLSCGKLTTGVTVREWTGVFMLAGSFSTSVANYLQTIFRVQSPCNKFGKIKETGYVFDFAPDRTLKMVASAVSVSAKAGKTSQNDKMAMGKFLNFCPVIGVSGSSMKEYSAPQLLQQLKKAYADKVVRNGFDDTNLYSDELLKLQDVDLKKFEKLQGIIGKSKAAEKTKDIKVNNQGLTDEEYEEQENLKKKPKKELTPEEKARLEELKKASKTRNDAISILRGISIRMPLLIYGANVPYTEDISLKSFVHAVDNASWDEFMPNGVPKKMFAEFEKYYDQEVFIAAGRRIRNIAKEADTLEPTERVKKIASLFSYFKNPDKETVLTPWRVVNMHLSDCIGGWDFWDEAHREILEEPRFVDCGEVTQDVFGKDDAKILEINSKTGLYPLYVTYSVYRRKCDQAGKPLDKMTVQERRELWQAAVRDNVFVICKTPMAKAITQRTLLGYVDGQTINAHYFDDLVNTLENKPKTFIDKVLKKNYWKKGDGKMKLDAVVGNPPYMEMDGGAQASARPIYQHFVDAAKKLAPAYASFITPTRWYAGGKGLDAYRDSMLNDVHLSVLHDFLTPESVFPGTNIRGGICYFLWNRKYDNHKDLARVITHAEGKVIADVMRPIKYEDVPIFIRNSLGLGIVKKLETDLKNGSIAGHISAAKAFGFRTYFINDANFRESLVGLTEPVKCYGRAQKIGFVERDEVVSHSDWIDNWKVLFPESNNIGTELNDDNQNSFVAEPGSVCTESFLVCGADLSLTEMMATNLSGYLRTKFARFMLSLAKSSQHGTAKTYTFVPQQDFSKPWTDEELYKKYGLTQEEISFIESMIKPMA